MNRTKTTAEKVVCFAIESTAHTFGAAVVERYSDGKGKILSNVKDMYSTTTGGMIPNDVAEHHKRVADSIIKQALEKAGLQEKDINIVAFAHGPGLTPALRVGKEKAVAFANRNNMPIIGVNHCVAHLTVGQLVTPAKDTVYLYVSGVNTQVIALASGKFRIFGETLDIGLGNALDRFGRAAGLGFPAGPAIEKEAEKARKEELLDLPYSVKGMDVSFAGILTTVERKLKEGIPVSMLCFALQEHAFAMLAEVAERAMAHIGKNELVLVGGVGANKRLCRMLTEMCEARGAQFYAVPLEYAGDQAAMIAWQGLLQHSVGGAEDPSTIDICPYERTDDVDVTWE